MDIDVGRIVFGCVLKLLIGPALWLPSMFAWRFRTESRRVRMLSQIIGTAGARLVYIGLGVLVSLVGLGFIAASFPLFSLSLHSLRFGVAVIIGCCSSKTL